MTIRLLRSRLGGAIFLAMGLFLVCCEPLQQDVALVDGYSRNVTYAASNAEYWLSLVLGVGLALLGIVILTVSAFESFSKSTTSA